ncbi:MAG: SMC family ATPase, partial [Firmicutes bacterium]|nr:SMC family ATPase [Bacillota bacterium]
LFDSVDLKDLISDIETKRRLEEEAKRKEAEIMQILNAVNKEREKSFVAFELAGVDLRHIENQIEVVVDEIKEQRQIVNFSGTRENARTELMEVINTLDALKISVDRINEEDALLIKEETRLKLEKSALIGDITLRRKAVERLDQEIRALLQNAGVKKEDVVNSTDFEDIEKLEEVVLQFERNYREISERIDRLNKLSPNNKTTVTEFKKIKEEVEAVQKEYIELVKKEEWLKHKAVEQEATLKKVEAYREEYRNVKEKLDETVKLFELIKSGEFLRFVVREYMVNITKRANSHLATLTSGRYQLAFDNDEFQVADNLYGSSRRSITTLSGGETFLASLALAVAVVESLTQFRPQKLEFMFLDEGFGTLDDESLVTVMNAFRNLKGDDFTIGIISHEDAVKNAVQNKIEVVKVHTADGAISLIE